MNALDRTARVLGAIALEAATVVGLLAIGRRSELVVPFGHLDSWVRDGEPATVLVALLRWVALAVVVWLLASTLLYLVAAASRAPAAMRAVRWSTLPAVRRTIDAACAVSVVTSVVLAPAAASAARAPDPPVVSLVRDGRGLRQLPPDATTTTPAPPAATRAPSLPGPVLPAPTRTRREEVVVAEGDNLWELAARHLAAVGNRSRADISDTEVAPYWVRVCDENRERLPSGDPNLISPGDRIVLPPVS
jgi:hypothetical protein